MRSAPFVEHLAEKYTYDDWSEAFTTTGRTGGRKKPSKDVGSAGQTLRESTLSLGNGRTYDHAEAARVAAAERAGRPLSTAYPKSNSSVDKSPFGRHQVGWGGKQLPAPVTVNLFGSTGTWPTYSP